MSKAIEVKSVSKVYKLYRSMSEKMFDLIRPKSYGEEFYALSNVSFTANHGEVIGFIGINGSGKSTLSNIIAGILPQTKGQINIDGEVALIAVSAGLKGDLTGRDNIELKLLMLGFSREKIKELETKIIEFSELGKFIDQPVKSYSSGMRSRLGFSISVNVDPEILIIDEALSVGDKAFAEKSLKKMKEFKARGKTMIFVSHSIGQMKKFCDKILWLEFGMVKEYGDVATVIPKYEDFLKKWQIMSKEDREKYRETAIRNQQKALENESFELQLNIDDFITNDINTENTESPVSMIGHFNGKKSYIYIDPSNIKEGVPSNRYKRRVYYIKKRRYINGEAYYLLSKKPSGVNGVIGWVNNNDLTVHQHITVDYDKKYFIQTGKGKAFNNPWGGKKNCVFTDLAQYKNEKFVATQTDFVGNNIWYKGDVEGKTVWLHSSSLENHTE